MFEFELLQGRGVVLIGCSLLGELSEVEAPAPVFIKVGCMMKDFPGSKTVLVSDEWGNAFKVLVLETEQMFDLEVRAWKV
jgi:hypothetical protein